MNNLLGTFIGLGIVGYFFLLIISTVIVYATVGFLNLLFGKREKERYEMEGEYTSYKIDR